MAWALQKAMRRERNIFKFTDTVSVLFTKFKTKQADSNEISTCVRIFQVNVPIRRGSNLVHGIRWLGMYKEVPIPRHHKGIE